MKLVNIPDGVCQYRLIRKLPDRPNGDLTGQKFNDYKVIGLAGIRNNQITWLCKCKCGTYRLMGGAYVKERKQCKKCSIKERNWGGLVSMGICHGKSSLSKL